MLFSISLPLVPRRLGKYRMTAGTRLPSYRNRRWATRETYIILTFSVLEIKSKYFIYIIHVRILYVQDDSIYYTVICHVIWLDRILYLKINRKYVKWDFSYTKGHFWEKNWGVIFYLHFNVCISFNDTTSKSVEIVTVIKLWLRLQYSIFKKWIFFLLQINTSDIFYKFQLFSISFF